MLMKPIVAKCPQKICLLTHLYITIVHVNIYSIIKVVDISNVLTFILLLDIGKSQFFSNSQCRLIGAKDWETHPTILCCLFVLLFTNWQLHRIGYIRLQGHLTGYLFCYILSTWLSNFIHFLYVRWRQKTDLKNLI